MIVVVMGVAGAGKTTVGRLLAQALGCPFLDGDALHPAANIEKMSAGIALSDADRAPWLAAVRARLEAAFERGENLVVACSALKQQYRDLLAAKVPVVWVYLKGTEELIRRRLQQRREHYMKAQMLPSQLAILEEPADAIVADVSASLREIAQEILRALRRRMTEPQVA